MPFPRRSNMAPTRKTAIVRLAAVVLCGVYSKRWYSAPTAFFAPAPPLTEELKTFETRRSSGEAENQVSLRSKTRDAKYHLKVLVSFEDINPFRGQARYDLQNKTQTTLALSGIGEYYPYSENPRKILVIAGDDKSGVLDALKIILQSTSKTNPTFLVPRSVSGQLVGVGGEKLQSLFARSGAKVSLRPSGFESQVTAFAPSIDAALAAAEYILNEEDSFVDDMRNCLSTNYLGTAVRGLQTDCTIYLPMTETQVAKLIGTGGEHLLRVKREFFVDIWTSRDDRDKDGYQIVKVSGAAGDVHAFHAYLLRPDRKAHP